MGWDIYLQSKDGSVVEVAPHTFGSNYVVGGSSLAETTVTFNYMPCYARCGVTLPDWAEEGDTESKTYFSPRWLNGRTGAETAPVLLQVIQALGIARSSDYWEGTKGNAGYAMYVLMNWAIQHPEAVWRVA